MSIPYPLVTFEDKKRENFERGNLELEKRRQALLELQRKEQERLATLEREEQERKVGPLSNKYNGIIVCPLSLVPHIQRNIVLYHQVSSYY